VKRKNSRDRDIASLERSWRASPENEGIAKQYVRALIRAGSLTVNMLVSIGKPAFEALSESDPDTVRNMAYCLDRFSQPGRQGALLSLLTRSHHDWFPGHKSVETCPRGHGDDNWSIPDYGLTWNEILEVNWNGIQETGEVTAEGYQNIGEGGLGLVERAFGDPSADRRADSDPLYMIICDHDMQMTKDDKSYYPEHPNTGEPWQECGAIWLSNHSLDYS
jgi:hypothetical protein